ncbi:unnamed protein product [Rhizoctonia solani]|uniref:Uncharacterized protein n=1 Tax=Rhizoctonia solani TaxID=456999 RepID=A0A8H3C980_9AGAM|nr:unnamed protein product [Rhizoctonia solani]
MDNMDILRGFQGLPVLSDEDRAAEHDQERPLVDLGRCFEGLQWEVPVSQWTNESIDGLYKYILDRQGRITLNEAGTEDSVFQWLMEHIGEALALEPSPTFQHIYGPQAAAYYIAMKRHEFPRDAYMPPTAKPWRWFTKNQLKSNKEHLTESIESLMEWIEINEKFKPPMCQPTDLDPGLLQCIPVDKHDLPEFILSFQFPPAVYNYDASNHESYTIIRLWKFICRQRAYQLAIGCWALQKLFVDLESGALALPDITFQVSFGKDQQNLLTTICDHDSPWGPRFIDLMVEGHVADYRLECIRISVMI